MAIHGFPGGVISATAPTVSPTSASGVWTLDDQLQNSANWPTTNVTLSNSVRTRASASAYMTRTPTVTSNRKTFTWSSWVKRGQLSSSSDFFIYQATGTGDFGYRFRDDTFQVYVYNGGYVVNLQTTQLFRDPSAWYHIVVATDTTQATASNRVKLYINGTQVTAFSTATYPSQNYDMLNINTASSPQYIGGSSSYFDGYLADVNFVDGQALTPSYFGATNPNTGVWQPSQYKGTYGTNGFYLPMNVEVLLKSFTKSLRFRASNSAYLSKNNVASPTDSKKWTWSAWVKRGNFGYKKLLSAEISGTDDSYLQFYDDQLSLGSYSGSGTDYGIRTVSVFRDPAAWYHIVAVLDTANATSADRAIIYVNGVRQTVNNQGNGMFPLNSTNCKLNTGSVNVNIGRIQNGSSTVQFDGYMAEINFIDGLALTPGYFGQTDTTSGAWQPVAYTGQYGANGYYLPFTNTTSTTTLGYDASGLNNNWTTNNFSLTAGVTYDSMTDVPTLTSATEANYCVLNPLAVGATASTTGGNLNFTQTATLYWDAGLATLGFSSGKYYWEMTTDASYPGTVFCGIAGSDIPYGTNNLQDANSTLNTYGSLLFCDDGQYKIDGGSRVSYSSSLTAGQVLGVAVDMDAKTCVFYVNGVSQGSINFSSSAMASKTVMPIVISYYNGSVYAFNFGQRPFAYSLPANHLALNAFNM